MVKIKEARIRSNRLKSIRDHRKMSIWQLRAITGVSTAVIGAIEKFDYDPVETVKERLAQGLQVEKVIIWPETAEPVMP